MIWMAISAVSLALLAFDESGHGNLPRVVFSLAITVCGLLLGNKLYNGPIRFLHPIVTCATVAHLGAGAGGLVEGLGWYQGIRMYLPEVSLHICAQKHPYIPCKGSKKYI